MSPQNIHNYRESTESHAKHFGMTQNRRTCCKCKRNVNPEGAKRSGGGTRHDPFQWVCRECQ